jgi:tRNA nucleotidyltransferase/poly(A) polymerase
MSHHTTSSIRRPFKIILPPPVSVIASVFHGRNKDLYLVGGCVRDAVMGVSPKDYDFATSLEPSEIKAILAEEGIKTLLIGESFGVVVAIASDGEQYEIATFRRDEGEGRRPDSVSFTTIEEDCLRRDLTMNALYYDILKEEIVDFVGGLEDIQNNIIRTVGNPEDRFREDRLRILRVIRFAARLGAEIEPETAAVIKQKPCLIDVSPERVRDEFLKCLKSARNVLTFFGLLDEYKLWSQIFPAFTVDRERIAPCRIPHVAIATLLNKHNHLAVEKHLKKTCMYTVGETTKIAFLIKFQSIGVETVSELKKMWNQMQSSDALRLSEKELHLFAALNHIETALVDKFLKVATNVINTEELMANGFKNAELGKEISRIDREFFQAS